MTFRPTARSSWLRPTRRRFLRSTAAACASIGGGCYAWAADVGGRSRARPGQAGWPSAADWDTLRRQVGGALVVPRSPWTPCATDASSAACTALFKSLKNPYFVGDDVALTQTLGWVDAWTSMASAYAVVARRTEDVAAAVRFARAHDLRLVVKGGGHSYQGTSNAPDSLLVWTRHMNDIALHDAYVPSGCAGRIAPTRAATIGAGALWSHAYDAVTTRAGGYVQGGGCMTVGVAGLVQSGGFGSFSKAFGPACASLLQAEVVTADGNVQIANPCSNPDLFWALKGGGGGSFGIVTRLTLKVHALPETFGAVNFTVRAKSDAAFRKLIALTMDFYARKLMNPHWGEQIRVLPSNALRVAMVFQGLTRSQASDVWAPYFATVDAAPNDYAIDFALLKIVSTSAREFFAATLPKRLLGFIRRDDRPDAPADNVYWPGDVGQVAQVLHGYGSTWLPAALLQPDRQAALADALYAASRHWGVGLHFNKGLAGATPEVLAAARDTAMNPAVLDAFALAISGAEEQPAYPGLPGHEPDIARARRDRSAVAEATGALRKVVPGAGSYVSESDYFERDWQVAHWGDHYARLLSVKAAVDPDDLFIVHHGVGSERWSADGFTRTA